MFDSCGWLFCDGRRFHRSYYEPLSLSPPTALHVPLAETGVFTLTDTVAVAVTDTAITPATGAVHFGGEASVVHVSRRKHDWFHTFAFFLPKSISEPWVGDIRETRTTMLSEGYSRVRIECATATQFLLLALHFFKETILDILTPFKNRSTR